MAYFKRIIAICMVVFSIFLCLPSGVLALSSPFVGQTIPGPYTISSAVQLAFLSEEVQAGHTFSGYTFSLKDNIDFSKDSSFDMTGDDRTTSYGEVWEAGSEWKPIGSALHPFAAVFDGENHTISGIEIKGEASNAGLFGYVSSSSVVKNLTVAGTVCGKNTVAGLVGCSDGATVWHCTNKCVVTATGSEVGGLVGACRNHALIMDCINSGAVTSTGAEKRYVGGVTGFATRMINCKNTGMVTGNGSEVGGLAGYLFEKVQNSYSISKVFGRFYVGNLFGSVASDAVVEHSFYLTGRAADQAGVLQYAIGSPKTGGFTEDSLGRSASVLRSELMVSVYNTYLMTEGYFEGLHLWQYNSAENGYPFFKEDIVNASDYTWKIHFAPNGGSGTISDLKTEGGQEITFPDGNGLKPPTAGMAFVGWSETPTESKTVIEAGVKAIPVKPPFGGKLEVTYYAVWKIQDTWADAVQGDFNPGQVSADKKTYHIQTANDLALLAKKLNDKQVDETCTVIFDADVDLAGHAWVPIQRYSGIIYGNNHTISGLNSPRPEKSGLFSSFGGSAFDLTISGTVMGDCYTGGFGGVAEKGSFLMNCHSLVDVKGQNYVGGFFGKASGLTMQNCTAKIKVNADSSQATCCGGLVGLMDDSSFLLNCEVSGTVMGINNVGSLAGSIVSSHVLECKASSKVQGTSCVGGLAGLAESVQMNMSSFSGDLSLGADTGNYLGGLVGKSKSGRITDCANTGNITCAAPASYIGGIVGYDEKTDLTGCRNEGSVLARSSAKVGGIVGKVLGDAGIVNVSDCLNMGTVRGDTDVGGVVGYADDELHMINITNAGKIQGIRSVAGLIGTVGYSDGGSEEYESISIVNAANVGVVAGEEMAAGLIAEFSVQGNCRLENISSQGTLGCNQEGYGYTSGGFGVVTGSGSLQMDNYLCACKTNYVLAYSMETGVIKHIYYNRSYSSDLVWSISKNCSVSGEDYFPSSENRVLKTAKQDVEQVLNNNAKALGDALWTHTTYFSDNEACAVEEANGYPIQKDLYQCLNAPDEMTIEGYAVKTWWISPEKDSLSYKNGSCIPVKEGLKVYAEWVERKGPDIPLFGLPGDANGDESLDMKDVLAMRKSLAGLSVTPYYPELADINEDGSVDMKDVLFLRKQLAGV